MGINTGERAISEILILFQNIFAGLAEYMKAVELEEYKKTMNELAIIETPSEEMFYKAALEVSKDPHIREKDKRQLVETIAKLGEAKGALPARVGLDELDTTVDKSSFDQETKERVHKIIQSARYSLMDPMSIIIDESQYDSMRKLIVSEGLNEIVSAFPLASGNYMFMFNMDIKEKMINIAK